MPKNTKIKIFIGLTEVSGYFSGLEEGLNTIGVSANFFDLSGHEFKYKSKHNLYISTIQILSKYALGNNLLQRIIAIIRLCSLIPLFIFAIFTYNIFIFSSGNSFFGLRDLRILKFLGKKVVFVYLGSDSRPPFLNRKFYDSNYLYETELACEYFIQKIKIVEKYADYIIDHPPCSHFRSKRFIQHLKLGIPIIVPSESAKENSKVQTDYITILHAPSYPNGKGTLEICDAIDSLISEGLKINFIKVINKTNQEVLDLISACDFIIDELYSDTRMAKFAAEAASFGKPAIVCGYLELSDLGNLESVEIPPVHYCRPDDIKDAIKKLYLDNIYRELIGNNAKEFVEKKWSIVNVASRYNNLLRDDFPTSWYYNPNDINYIYGWGLSKNLLRKYMLEIKSFDSRFFLRIFKEKPKLQNAIESFLN
jgi:hypothetical protein